MNIRRLAACCLLPLLFTAGPWALPATAAPHVKHRAGHPSHPHKNLSQNKALSQTVSLIDAIQTSTPQHPQAVIYALQHGGDINERNKDGDTPLICAASQKWPKLTRLLVRLGADLAAEDSDGLNALDLAATPDIEAILINAGAKGSKKDLDVAADSLETEDVLKSVYVEGYVNNLSKAPFDFVRVEAVFLDGAGTQIDSGSDITEHLAAGGRWKFKIPCFRDGVTGYKIVKVSGQ